jgi:polygalacturonase
MKVVKVTDNINVFADGIHDDTKALQECIDSVKDGGTIYFPDGTYLISATLIFYSDQVFKLSDNAVILRSDKGQSITRYLLASYSESDWGEYEGTHDVTIMGGIFDGNANVTEKSTLVNTVHCRNIRIIGSRFRNCSTWHMIELNSTENAIVTNCIFDGPTYTVIHENLLNEQIQLDLARDGSYGPVYNCDGKLIDFCNDDTVCRNIIIANNLFKCAGFPAIGHHGDCGHHNIFIENNIFDGSSGLYGKSRGYIIFRPMVYDVEIKNNIFISEKASESPNYGIVFENPCKDRLLCENNIFVGPTDKEIIIGEGL